MSTETMIETVAQQEPDLEALAMPSEVEESRPGDIDDCRRCEGHGQIITVEDGEKGYRLCRWCLGTGQRGAA